MSMNFKSHRLFLKNAILDFQEPERTDIGAKYCRVHTRIKGDNYFLFCKCETSHEFNFFRNILCNKIIKNKVQ